MNILGIAFVLFLLYLAKKTYDKGSRGYSYYDKRENASLTKPPIVPSREQFGHLLDEAKSEKERIEMDNIIRQLEMIDAIFGVEPPMNKEEKRWGKADDAEY